MKELPEKFTRKQFLDKNYKIGDGESQKEVRDRMYSTIVKILENNSNKKIVIVSHATAISYLLRPWREIAVEDDKLRYSFNGKIIFDDCINYCETFKLDFDDNNNIVSIENII